ncbi:HepT-like ribonuclease domain-containing protein [Hydrogenimonas sp.]
MHRSLELIYEKILLIESIVSERGGITEALADEKLSKPAILMHLIAIAEQFKRLQEKLEYDTLSRFDKEDIRGAFAIRNFIAHDYEGVNMAMIEEVVRTYLPKIKKVIENEH